jgi:hypothetical protein
MPEPKVIVEVKSMKGEVLERRVVSFPADDRNFGQGREDSFLAADVLDHLTWYDWEDE